MRQNYYYALAYDGEVVAHGSVRAHDGDEARDKVFARASECIDMERYKKKRWDIVVAEQPFPVWIKSMEDLRAHSERYHCFVFFDPDTEPESHGEPS